MRAGPWPDAPEDRVLLARVARQDPQAFRILVDRHLASIVTLARRMLKDEAEAGMFRSGMRGCVVPSGLSPAGRVVIAQAKLAE